MFNILCEKWPPILKEREVKGEKNYLSILKERVIGEVKSKLPTHLKGNNGLKG